jgi:hypothetical protein
MNTTDTECRKKEIAARLVDLAREESQLLIDRPLSLPEVIWSQYMERVDEIDGERRELRKELFDLCRAETPVT